MKRLNNASWLFWPTRDDGVLALCLCTFAVSVPWRVLHISVPADGRKAILAVYLCMLSLVASCRFVSLPFPFPRFYIPGWDLETWGGVGKGCISVPLYGCTFVILRLKRVTESQYVNHGTSKWQKMLILTRALCLLTGQESRIIYLPFLTCPV